jgi:hypothetical protein
MARSASAPTTSIVSVKALPVAVQRGQGLLTPTKLNTVTASTALGFRVKVRNQGTSYKTYVTVTLTMNRPARAGGPLVTQETLGVIAANQTKTVTFDHLGNVPFATPTNLTVKASNGKAKVYPVIFSLPSGNFATTPTTPIRIPPKVVGLDQQAAIQKLEAAGFQVLIAPVYAKRPAGRVLGQRTGADIRVTGGPPGQVVEINVSNGKKPG